MDLSDKKIVIIGGGLVAQRRMCTLMNFGVDITVVSPDLTDEIKKKIPEIRYICDIYKKEYIENSWLVLACTNNREINRKIGIDAKEKNILVNVCDNKDECDFYFPGIVTHENTVIGICGSGSNHSATKRVIDRIRRLFK